MKKKIYQSCLVVSLIVTMVIMMTGCGASSGLNSTDLAQESTEEDEIINKETTEGGFTGRYTRDCQSYDLYLDLKQYAEQDGNDCGTFQFSRLYKGENQADICLLVLTKTGENTYRYSSDTNIQKITLDFTIYDDRVEVISDGRFYDNMQRYSGTYYKD